MPDLNHFLAALVAAGVSIRNESKLVEKLASADEWQTLIACAVVQGLRDDIRLFRTEENQPSDDDLAAIFRSYAIPESEEQTLLAYARIKHTDAWWAGCMAARDGNKINPYGLGGSLDSYDWADGWHENRM